MQLTLDGSQILLLLGSAFSAMAGALGILWRALSEREKERVKDLRAEIEKLRFERDEYKRELFQALGLTDRTAQALDRATSQGLVQRMDVDERLRRLEARRDVRQSE